MKASYRGKGHIPYKFVKEIQVIPAQTRMLWNFFRDNLKQDADMLYDENEYSDRLNPRRKILRDHKIFKQFTQFILNYSMLYYNFNAKMKHVGVDHHSYIDIIRLLTYKDMIHVMKGYTTRRPIPNTEDQFTISTNKTKIKILDHADGDGLLLDFVREFRKTLNKYQINIFYLGKNRVNKKNHVELRYKKKVNDKVEKITLTPRKTNEYDDIYYSTMKYNNFIKSQNITIKKQFRINNPVNLRNNSFKRLFSVFSTKNVNNFEVGGRYYGHWCQALKSEYRKHIKINGKETIECDYQALHPTMLYHREGIDFDGDIYSLEKLVVKDKKTNKNKLVDHENEFTRREIKISLNVMLNAANFKSAVNAVSHQLVMHKIDASVLLKSIIVKHRKISKHFCSSAWRRNQKLESSIATHIINYFTSMRKVVLCIHDSFIVQKDDEGLLNHLMVEAYQKIMGKNFKPKVTSK